VTIAKRADFVRASRAKRIALKGFILQARKRGGDEPDAGQIRIGYTCSKKVGNAVARNRAKRRLLAVAREVLTQNGVAGYDYVLIGRNTVTATRPFTDMLADLRHALKVIHGRKDGAKQSRPHSGR
jgi:ribonuclease P protein component